MTTHLIGRTDINLSNSRSARNAADADDYTMIGYSVRAGLRITRDPLTVAEIAVGIGGAVEDIGGGLTGAVRWVTHPGQGHRPAWQREAVEVLVTVDTWITVSVCTDPAGLTEDHDHMEVVGLGGDPLVLLEREADLDVVRAGVREALDILRGL